MSISMLSVRTVHGNQISITYKGEICITNYERTLCCDRSRYGGIHGTTGVYVIRITKDFTVSEMKFGITAIGCFVKKRQRIWLYVIFYNYLAQQRKMIVCLPSFHKYQTQKIMKKFVLSLGLLCAATVCAFAGHHVWIHTSCGVSIDMVYEDHHTGADVPNDALLLEAYFCGD